MTTITSANTKDYKIITFLASILLPKLKEDSPSKQTPYPSSL